MSRVSACRIDVLADTVGVTYEYAELEQKFLAASGVVALSIADSDIRAVAADPPPAARFELRLEKDASVVAAAFLSKAHDHLFRFSCNEQTLFVGVVYMAEGAAALETPVLHVVEASGDELVLHLVAWQSAWWANGVKNDEAARRIDRPELRAAFCARGALSELP